MFSSRFTIDLSEISPSDVTFVSRMKYELCIDKIMKIGNEIDSKGHLYIDFESALPYYKQYGIIDEDSEEIKEFNDIMDFLYLGRRTKLDSFIKLKEPYVTLNVIAGDNNIDESI